jgi:Ribbon-helix-helix protein, copG family
MKSAKVAVSMPADTLRAIERERRRLGLSRSAVFQEAALIWIQQNVIDADEKRYVEGYLRQPEGTDESAAVAGAATSTWEPWE